MNESCLAIVNNLIERGGGWERAYGRTDGLLFKTLSVSTRLGSPVKIMSFYKKGFQKMSFVTINLEWFKLEQLSSRVGPLKSKI